MAVLCEQMFDGAALAITFAGDPNLALSTFIAIWAHEVPG